MELLVRDPASSVLFMCESMDVWPLTFNFCYVNILNEGILPVEIHRISVGNDDARRVLSTLRLPLATARKRTRACLRGQRSFKVSVAIVNAWRLLLFERGMALPRQY